MPLPTISTAPTSKTRQPAWVPYAVGVALLPLVYLLLIDRVGSLPIYVWDEGRLAVNAAEMDQNGHWLVTYFLDQPDMWNTKPPLLIWLEVLSLRLFGYSETAFRLPTILAAVCTVGGIYTFCWRQLHSMWAGVCAALVLMTTIGYNDMHGARTGDYDTLLTLWVTMAALSFFRYIEEGKRSFFIWTSIALTLAVLTKGVAGLFWVPAFALYAATQKRFLWLLRRPEVYAGAVVTIMVVAGYYLAREHYNPGYLKAVSENELGGRLLTTLEKHLYPWYWYLSNMYEEKFWPWVLAFPLAFLHIWRQDGDNKRKRFALYVVILVLVHLVVISSASTKLLWYDIPMYPVAAMLIGLSLGRLAENLMAVQQQKEGAAGARLAGALFILVVFAAPITLTRAKSKMRQEYKRTDAFHAHGLQIRYMAEQLPQITAYSVYTSTSYHAAILFYKTAAQKRYGHTMTPKFSSQVEELKAGEVVVVCGAEDKSMINARFETEVLLSSEMSPCATLRLTKRR
ncbi:glycosyltransferase family 39 protein [Hymenobacter aerilatus]|uniref:Glycosyltransferase family 39 protein n=1 Tax=Hymenobacter aerilatus TaxID=2932251 RepID=A0A8T9SX39_9BACT|nr:glycosyltransferase family 39 protein [Hymenobacter aerilatus]UOR06792.1 glycosyltransferase family 39 protein [Hymenobacter aerilatus]